MASFLGAVFLRFTPPPAEHTNTNTNTNTEIQMLIQMKIQMLIQMLIQMKIQILFLQPTHALPQLLSTAMQLVPCICSGYVWPQLYVIHTCSV